MILLRKIVDKKLKEHKLEFLHLSYQSNFLYLSGECGRQYVFIKGIECKKILTKDEREFLGELIGKWIDNNVDNINRILELNSLLNVQFPLPENTYFNESGNNNSYIEYKGLRVYPDNSVSLYSVGKNSEEYYKKLFDHVPELKRVLSEYMKYREERKEYQKELNKLQTCEL